MHASRSDIVPRASYSQTPTYRSNTRTRSLMHSLMHTHIYMQPANYPTCVRASSTVVSAASSLFGIMEISCSPRRLWNTRGSHPPFSPSRTLFVFYSRSCIS